VIIQQIEVPVDFQRKNVATMFVTMLAEICKEHGRGLQVQNLITEEGILWGQSLLNNNNAKSEWYTSNPDTPWLGDTDFNVFSK
jgi:hypothetical protein